MNYRPEERFEVIRQAYQGLFELVKPMMFDRYADFIDAYAEIQEDEREEIYRQITDGEETVMTVMLAQYIKDKGFKEGIQQGIEQGVQQGIQQGVQQGIQQGVQQGIQQGVQQGIQQGVQQGIQQGVQQGRYVLLERILTRRFGTLPDWAQQRLKAAPSEQLDRWAERVLEAESLQGVITE
jgi:flagellar biosynthesis/type III secretory pathway protein FliH